MFLNCNWLKLKKKYQKTSDNDFSKPHCKHPSYKNSNKGKHLYSYLSSIVRSNRNLQSLLPFYYRRYQYVQQSMLRSHLIP